MDVSVGRIRAASLALVAALAVTACDDKSTNTRVVYGSPFQPSLSPFAMAPVSAQIQPSFLIRRSVATFGCPTLPPFATTFQIVVQRPPVDVVMGMVKIRFIDGSGIGGSPITFPTNELNRLFGGTLIRARTIGIFPFTLGFGCFPVKPAMLTANVTLVDANGASTESAINANIQ